MAPKWPTCWDILVGNVKEVTIRMNPYNSGKNFIGKECLPSASARDRADRTLIFVFRSLCFHLTDCPYFPSEVRLGSACEPWSRTSTHRAVFESGRAHCLVGLTHASLFNNSLTFYSRWLAELRALHSLTARPPQVVINPPYSEGRPSV